MRTNKYALLVVVGLLAVAGILGCAKKKEGSGLPMNPTWVARAAVAEFGSNGKISAEQLQKVPSLAELADKDGNVAADAIRDRIEQWMKAKRGRVMWNCRVMHNGKPLEGAKVSFVPEKFLDAYYWAAEGVTGPDGLTSLKIPSLESPGLTPGFYRVEITKRGESIPAKYNIETTLGQAVNSESNGLGATYDLKY